MSGLEALIPFIYHEKQQSGSQLCAQHALNTILQGDFFSAPDLAQFAQQLDILEGSFNNDAGSLSNNMDDTGFFSVEVLERALRVWGFTLVRWRSQDLRDQQEAPHSQMAFLLNHQQHWFSLRRFGTLGDPDNGHWFNLNSFLKNPEWVGKLYLGMVLSQAEDEGYSVFAVLPTRETPDGPTILPRTEADEIASNLSQPTSSNTGTRLSMSRVPEVPSRGSAPPPGFEDEDLELQAAIQASMSGGDGETGYAALAASHPRSFHTPNLSSGTPLSRPTELGDDSRTNHTESHDAVAASMARNKAIMQRMLREQEMALREGYEEEDAFGFGGVDGAGTASRRSGDSSSLRPRPRARSADGSEEEEALRRALEESRGDRAVETPDDGTMPGAMPVLDSEHEEPRPPEAPRVAPPRIGDRVYDDEDSELQAALKASLESIPEGFNIPATPPRMLPTNVQSASSSSAQPEHANDEPEEHEELKPSEEIDAEEMRRRRLARFGG